MKRMAAHHIGCLAVTDNAGDIIGVVSERDYLCKVALLGRNSRVSFSFIYTSLDNLNSCL